MNSGIFELISTFVRVVELGSFTGVATERNSTQPTISRQISALEYYLKVRLINRTTRKLELTEQGQIFYPHATALLINLDQAKAAVFRGKDDVSGTMKVTGSVAFTRIQIVPRIKRFLDKWPDLSVDFMLEDRLVDLLEEDIDLGIRIGHVTDPTLTAIPITEMRRITIATPEYLEKHGTPEHPRDLIGHDCIVYSGLKNADEWLFEDADNSETIRVKISGRIRTSTADIMGAAVLNGNGIAVAPNWAFTGEINSGSLIRILERFEPSPLPINLVHPSRRLVTPRMRAFIEFLINEYS